MGGYLVFLDSIFDPFAIARIGQKSFDYSGNDTLGIKVSVNLAEIVRVGWGQEERISNFSTRSRKKIEIISS